MARFYQGGCAWSAERLCGAGGGCIIICIGIGENSIYNTVTTGRSNKFIAAAERDSGGKKWKQVYRCRRCVLAITSGWNNAAAIIIQSTGRGQTPGFLSKRNVPQYERFS